MSLKTPRPLITLQKPPKQERLPSCFQDGDEKIKMKMAEQTADFMALLVAFVARLSSQYGVNIVKSIATWSKVNNLAISKDMDPKTWK